MERVSLTGMEVLKLNAVGRAIRLDSVEKVFGDFATYQVDKRGEFIIGKGNQKFRKMLAYAIEWHRLPDGTYDTVSPPKYIKLLNWDQWLELPITDYELQNGLYLRTPKMQVRIPRVVISLRYEDMPEKRFSINTRSVYELYEGIDPYTKKKVPLHEGNLDHIHPQSRGGKTEWKNIVWCSREINTRKGNRLNSEVGLPQIEGKVPSPIEMDRYLRNAKNIPEWNVFLRRKKQHYGH